MKLTTPNKKAISGYTLIELLVVTSIMALLFVVGMAAYNQFNRTQVLQQAALDLKNNLRLAQNKALSGEKPSDCGTLEGYKVIFSATGYQIRPRCDQDKAPTPAAVKNYALPSSISFKTIPATIFFKGLGQGLDDSAKITLTLTAFGLEKVITVSKTGEIK